MSGKGRCETCAREFEVGERVWQLLSGNHVSGFETPGFQDVLAEWCEECSGPDEWQGRPYQCAECGKPLETGERVWFQVSGDYPAPPAKVVERRGHELAFIAHPKCLETPA